MTTAQITRPACPEWCTGCGSEPMTSSTTGEHTSPQTRLSITPSSVTTSLSQFYDCDGSSGPEMRLHIQMHEMVGDAEAFLMPSEIRLIAMLQAGLAQLEAVQA